MSTNGELVYSNDQCCAFLTAIVKAFQTHHPTSYLGRTAMQKLAYFIQALGVPVPCSFGIYTYGPYSDTVSFAVESLLADDVIEDASSNPKYSNYQLGRNAPLVFSNFVEELRPHEAAINRTVKLLGAFSPNDLELIATVHFIARRQVQTTGNASKNSVIVEFKSIKKDKFPDEEINIWYDSLVGAGLI
jgi:uncharacterized protein YwgA